MQSFQKSLVKTGILPVILSLLLVSGLTACDSDDGTNGMTPNMEMNIVEQAQASDDLSTLAQAIADAGLAGTLESGGPFTVFAPTDAAFGSLPEGTLSSLTNEQLAEILTFHVITGEVMASDLQASQSVETVQGEELLVTASGGTVTVNGSAVVATADVEASNGVIHIIDSVLLPQAFRDPNIVDTAEELGNFTTLVGALDQTGLKTTVQYTGPFTVFAPTDDAFNALPSGLLGSLSGEQLAEILQYHVISGTVASGDLSAMQAPSTLTGENIFITADGSVTVNGSSSVVTADVTASNGIIHAIDEVLLPNKFLNVVQIASKRYDLTSLVSAVVEADLASTLADPDAEFTIFAPNNEAFEGVDTSGLTQQQLTEILTYHVVGARILSGDLSDGQTATTVNGADLTISIDGGTVSINGDAAVVRTVDLEGTNGVIHIIDGVLMPPSS